MFSPIITSNDHVTTEEEQKTFEAFLVKYIQGRTKVGKQTVLDSLSSLDTTSEQPIIELKLEGGTQGRLFMMHFDKWSCFHYKSDEAEYHSERYWDWSREKVTDWFECSLIPYKDFEDFMW
jgi:ribosomal protein L16 Arg81 hydroxylase